jgi:hypothetical protein
MSARDLSTAMMYLDSDRSGKIDKREFVQWWMDRRAGKLDLNGDGTCRIHGLSGCFHQMFL